MRKLISLIFIIIMMTLDSSAIAQMNLLEAKLRECATLTSDAERLECYDEVVRGLADHSAMRDAGTLDWDFVKGDASILESLGEKIIRSKKRNRPTFVFFTADWAVLCRKLDASVFSASGLLKESIRFTMIKVDITNMDPGTSGALLEKYQVGLVPSVVFFDSSGNFQHDLTLHYDSLERYLSNMRTLK